MPDDAELNRLRDDAVQNESEGKISWDTKNSIETYVGTELERNRRQRDDAIRDQKRNENAPPSPSFDPTLFVQAGTHLISEFLQIFTLRKAIPEPQAGQNKETLQPQWDQNSGQTKAKWGFRSPIAVVIWMVILGVFVFEQKHFRGPGGFINVVLLLALGTLLTIRSGRRLAAIILLPVLGFSVLGSFLGCNSWRSGAGSPQISHPIVKAHSHLVHPHKAENNKRVE